ncbi:MAG: 2-oxoacid:acceptor oxidoreductase family protein, partial [Hyphomicrobium sp.]|nr:2-oxoacid:acceptor oxidoreductase family protein [Hyphomicrobium sp.]
ARRFDQQVVELPLLGQAAHLDGKGFGSIDMTGLAQKGGAVACHIRVAKSADDIHAIRIGTAASDLVIGCDLVVTASNKVLETIRPDHTAVVASTYEMPVADFTRNPDLKVPGAALLRAIEERVRKGDLHKLDAHELAVRLFADSIASNMFMLGYAYQLGKVPVSAEAIEKAIELNGAAIEMNRSAFRFGRLAAHDMKAIERIVKPRTAKTAPTLADITATRVTYLTDYQDAAYAKRFSDMVDRIAKLEAEKLPGSTALAEAVAWGYYKLLSYKDEYEVGRLQSDGRLEQAIKDAFDGNHKLEFHLAPPAFAWFFRDKVTGHPRKISLGAWMMPVFRLLAKGKKLRGTRWDLFGMTAERKLERQMILDYEAVLGEIERRLSKETHATAIALARLPEEIRGFGHVKLANYEKAKRKEASLLAMLRDPKPARVAAE